MYKTLLFVIVENTTAHMESIKKCILSFSSAYWPVPLAQSVAHLTTVSDDLPVN